MRRACLVAGVIAVTLLPRTRLGAQQGWRERAAHVGGTARVLLVGTRPEDEDNALMAWLALGRHVETAYLSLTRGEAGVNVIGAERQAPLGVVRTAELLAERHRDGAHQYFTRAYDFGPTETDSIAERWWPHDSLRNDVVSVVRAFRPHVVIALLDSAGDNDATRRLAARLAAEAYAAAGDTVRVPTRATSRLGAWTPSRLYTLTDAVREGTFVEVNVGELDRDEGFSYAEIGAQIRQLQRTQGLRTAPRLGSLYRRLRLDSSRVGIAPAFFGALDTSFARFGRELPATVLVQLDTLGTMLGDVRSAPNGRADSIAVRLARVASRTSAVRLALPCTDIDGVPACAGAAGDLAVALNTIRARATSAMLDAAGLVIDAAVERQLVALGDAVRANVTVYNGGGQPIALQRLELTTRETAARLVRDSSVVIGADSTVRWTTSLRVLSPSYHWWQVGGLIAGTLLHNLRSAHGLGVYPQLIRGEDGIITSDVEATVAVGGVAVPVILEPLAYRASTALRGDDRRPLTGVPQTSVLLERNAEYERAGLTIDRLFRAYLWSAHSTPDTLAVTLRLPSGLHTDSTTRTVVLPPFGSRSVFFRLRGRLSPGADTISATARVARLSREAAVMDPTSEFLLGVVVHEYPHIPTQPFVRFANERVEVVDLHVPARLHVAYVKGTDDVPSPLGQLQINLQTLEPSLLPVVDLSGYSTVLIGANAFANDALMGAVPALLDFARKGGAVVVLPNGADLGRAGLMPYPIAFDSVRTRVTDAATVQLAEPRPQVLRWPHLITAKDFEGWGDRARNAPLAFDPRYRTAFSLTEPNHAPVTSGILLAAVGKGVLVFTSLALDEELAAANPAAAKLMINLLAAGLRPERGN